MKALSLWQPWAQLVATGVKRVETRPWATSYRGPLAIHATASQQFVGIDFYSEHSRLGWDLAQRIGRELRPKGYEPMSVQHPSQRYQAPGDEWVCVGVPLGAVVATCDLVDVLHIGRIRPWSWQASQCAYVAECEHEGDQPNQQGGLWIIGPNPLSNGTPTRIEDQRPWGDFTEGRYAWLLEDIKPVEPPVPAKGRQRLWNWRPE